jgi:atypical dual specificity phosphatase
MSYCGARALEPFYSEINEFLVIGSLPLQGDGNTLVSLNCGAVVNMCRESEGPISEYNRLGIIQHRAPTADLCPPSLQSLITACEFMKEFRRNFPSKRIFVHCKGGRARAATMALCFLLSEDTCQGFDQYKVLEMLQSKRKVITSAILKYEVIEEFKQHITIK